MISRGGRPVPGFALGDASSSTTQATPVVAAVMVGATIGLLSHVVFKSSTGVAILTGAGATILAKIGIDKASA